MPLSISLQTVHLWLAELSGFENEIPTLLASLSPDEIQRARRLHFQLDKDRFIISRGLLRRTLSLYTDMAPHEIVFSYGPHGKPYLQKNSNALQFNVSHSGNFVIFALTTQQEVGVDIQQIEPHFREDVAKRFFGTEEYTELMELAEEARVKGFYQIWCRKEALIKTLGQGVFMSLSDFSVNLSKQKVSISSKNLQRDYYMENIDMPEGYQAAIATVLPIKNIIYKRCTA